MVLDFPLLDTRGEGRGPEPHREIPGRHGAADTGLCGTEKERENIRQRQAEASPYAKAAGSAGGEKENVPPEFPGTYTAWKNGEISEGQLLEVCGMKRSTLYKSLQEKRACQRE